MRGHKSEGGILGVQEESKRTVYEAAWFRTAANDSNPQIERAEKGEVKKLEGMGG